ncbi:minor capsid [Citromicrobium phage vB_CbaS-RXM]|nr:minor capsid [Citromicrobium phage vB_CbaS-RXM]
MANMNTSHRYVYDAAPATLFRARTAAALTANGNSNTVNLDKLDGYWNTDGELADETLAVIVNVTALDTADGDETYSLALQPLDGAGAALTGVSLGTLPIKGIGQYVLLVDAATVKQCGDLSALRIAATVAGTTPSITFHAWMSQIKKA